jgi:hypothetical protein
MYWEGGGVVGIEGEGEVEVVRFKNGLHLGGS